MLRPISTLFSLFLAFLPFAAAQKAQVWSPVEAVSVPENIGERRIIPLAYQTFQLNAEALESALSDAELAIPMPDGTTSRFRIQEAQVMHPDLAKQFPEIKTFKGTGIDLPGASARLDWTPQGFHAMVFIPGESMVFVDPYAWPNTQYYISYFKKDFDHTFKPPFECGVDESKAGDDTPKPGEDMPEAGDCKLRTYMLALACTGEYATYHGGTVPLALAAMNTTMNRVNGVFERDLGVTMQLVPNNDLLVFLNPNTDPYSNGNGSAMLQQNINTCNSIIGAPNYDIGHVFSTGGGGVAYLSCVCGSNKAGGVTGSGNPVGDPFDIDYVAHEMGHQYGGRHTQNNSCNRDNQSSYEPGSASTIMGYAGICSPNVQSNSDDYFHINSILLMSNFITGTGNSCATVTTTGNGQPTADAGPNYVIPRSTYFVLTGQGSDPDNDPLTYCWEQYDRQIATQPPLPTNTQGPAFRSLDPTPSPLRYFPNIDAIVNNQNPTWEVLASVGRTYNFQLTVRDNNPGAGCTAQDAMVVTVASNSGPFLVTAPNTFVNWPAFTQQTVTWNVASTTAAPVNCQNVDILLSLDGGYTYPITLLSNTPNDGSQEITVPYNPTTTARIMVRGSNNIFFDISNANFQISGPLQTFAISMQPPLQQACPGSPVTYALTLTAFGNYTGTANLSVEGLPPGVNAVLAPNPANIPGTAQLVLTGAPGSGLQGSLPFTVTATNQFETQTAIGAIFLHPDPPAQTALVYPANGATDVELQPAFQWTPSAGVNNYFFQLATDPDFNNILIELPYYISTTFTPGAALPEGSTFYWRVKAMNFCGDNGFSPVFAFKTLTVAPPETCLVFSSINTPVELAPGAAAASLLPVEIAGTITDVNVLELSITHPDINQVVVGLYSPAGTPVALFNGLCPGGNGENLLLSLDDEAGNTYSEVPCPPVDPQNAYQPKSPLAAVNDESMEGDWILDVQVFPTAPAGVLESWSLEICFIPEGEQPLGFDLILKDASCHGASDGAAVVEATGGSGNYSASWSTGESGLSIIGLAAGNYQVTVSDGVTTLSESFTIGQPAAIQLGLATSPAQNGNDGAIDLTVSGGLAPYAFAWSNGADTEDISELSPGVYCVTVTDAAGCKAEGCATVQGPNSCAPWTPTTITPSSTGCFIAWAAVPGASKYRLRYQPVGNPPFMWTIIEVNSPATSLTISGLTPGSDYVFQTATFCEEAYTEWSEDYFFTTLESSANACKAWKPGAITTTEHTASIQIQPVPGGAIYLIRYRPLGATNWTNAATANLVFNLSNLLPGTTYEFRTLTRCSNGTTSPMSAATYLFTTQGSSGRPAMEEVFTIRPNPAREYLEWDYLPFPSAELTVTSLNGQRVMRTMVEGGQTRLEIGQLEEGMYFITLRAEGIAPVTRRFIKVR